MSLQPAALAASACGGHHAGGQAGAVGQLQPGQQALGQAVGTVGAAAGADADRTHVGLHAGGDGGHGAGRIRRLRIGVVGLAERRGREALPGQQVLFARTALLLALVDARGGHGGQAHAVAQEQDDVLGLAGHRAVGGRLGGTAAVPPLRGLTGRVGDGIDGDLEAGRGGRGGSAGAGAQQQGGGAGGQQGDGTAHGRRDLTNCNGTFIMPGPARHADDTLICRPGGRSAGRLGLSFQHPFFPSGLPMKLVSAWLRIPFWQRVVGGFVLGALAGWALGPAAETWFGPLGELYVTLIKMIAVPLVFFAVINAISSLHGQKSVAALSGRTFLWFVITAALAVCVGLGVGTVLQPGAGGLQLSMASNYVPREVPSVVQVLLDVVPANVFYALSGIGTKVNAAGETAWSALPSSSWARR
ncbi:hypothetical protein G6F68_010544 [Rhizopus microsporus]|nr:hypothetical protein G6F68_010544 [Rhizopus microsporus]